MPNIPPEKDHMIANDRADKNHLPPGGLSDEDFLDLIADTTEAGDSQSSRGAVLPENSASGPSVEAIEAVFIERSNAIKEKLVDYVDPRAPAYPPPDKEGTLGYQPLSPQDRL